MDIQLILNYEIFGLKITPVAIAIFIVSFSFLLKNIIAKIVLQGSRKIASKTKTTADDKIIDAIEEPLKMGIVLAGFYFAKMWLPFERFDNFLEMVMKSFFIFLLFWLIYRIADRFSTVFTIFSSKFGKELSKDIENFIKKTLRLIVIILGVMAILQEWGINVSAFVASLGLGGLAFALAAKDTVANLFGSLVIFTDRPFKVDDWIQTPDIEGNVEEIGIRSTKIRTFSQALVSIPNATIANVAITNWSQMGKRRIRTRIGLTYGTTASQMEGILQEIAKMLKNHEGVHQDTIIVSFDEFESSSLSILLNFFTKTIDTIEYLKVRESVNFEIMKIVEKAGATFAFPSQSLYIESMPKS
ncbi:MAG: mechanosensitive ion channel family protein [Sulfurospirillaceae bacterium]|nr:mechanosensitive ion channel family protein [Sulfurospirillaceae bacterium]